MRILHCNDSFWPRTTGIGGIQAWLTHLASQQIAEGHTVGVMTWPWADCEERAVWNGVHVFRWSIHETEAIRFPEKMQELLRASDRIKREFQPDVLHLHLNQLASWIATVGARPPRTVLTVHLPADHPGLQEKLRRRVLADADLVVAPSLDSREFYAERYPELEEKLRVVPHGLLLPHESPVELDASDQITFLCLGRLVPEKGFHVAIRALALAERRDFRLIIAGEGSMTSILSDLASQLGVADRVDFRGWISPDAVSAFIQRATVVLVPSLWREPFGLVALEAAQLGRPVIASRIGALPEVVRDGESGRLVPAGDVQTLAQAMIELGDNDALRRAMSEAAKSRARESFSMDVCSSRYHSLYVKSPLPR